MDENIKVIQISKCINPEINPQFIPKLKDITYFYKGKFRIVKDNYQMHLYDTEELDVHKDMLPIELLDKYINIIPFKNDTILIYIQN